MYNSEFWEHIKVIISGDFTPEGLTELEEYADNFTCGQLLYKRFSPSEQHGCTTGGHAHVIASLLAGTEISSDSVAEGENDYKRQCQRGETQARNWTFATPDIYLSDMHDENVLRTKLGGVAVVDCDIRINTLELRCGGTRKLSTEIEFRLQ